MNKTNIKAEKRVRRHVKIRTRVFGTDKRPRLSIFKSNAFVYAQIIDDENSKTIVSADSRKIKGSKKKAEASFEVGKMVAKSAIEKGVKTVVFDRGGFKYAGRVKALADGAREGGLKF